MTRIKPLQPDEVGNDVQTIYAGAEKLTGSVSNLTKTLAHSPLPLLQLLPFLVVLQRGGGTSVANRYKELAILKTSMINDCYG